MDLQENKRGSVALEEKCRRICGDSTECEAMDKRHLRCIAETITEKAAGISDALVQVYKLKGHRETLKYLDRALALADDLVSNLRYMQVTGDLRKLNSLHLAPEQEQRRETRYPLPEAYSDQIGLSVDYKGLPEHASLLNFSNRGVQFKFPEPLPEGGYLDCVLTTSRSHAEGVRFRIKVKYVMEQEQGFIVGGEVEEIADGAVVDLCRRVFDFMMNLSLGE